MHKAASGSHSEVIQALVAGKYKQSGPKGVQAYVNSRESSMVCPCPRPLVLPSCSLASALLLCFERPPCMLTPCLPPSLDVLLSPCLVALRLCVSACDSASVMCACVSASARGRVRVLGHVQLRGRGLQPALSACRRVLADALTTRDGGAVDAADPRVLRGERGGGEGAARQQG
eukprot:3644100-Rhodomonas_salina.2